MHDYKICTILKDVCVRKAFGIVCRTIRMGDIETPPSVYSSICFTVTYSLCTVTCTTYINFCFSLENGQVCAPCHGGVMYSD